MNKIKANNSLMGMLCLMNKLLKIKYILALFLLVNSISIKYAVAQDQISTLAKLNIPEGGLKIGDKIPEELWNLPLQVINHPEGKETITLNDYRDKKLIILDFWSTNCAGCISLFPELKVLQENFNDDVAIILSNDFKKDTALEINRVLGKSTIQNSIPVTLYHSEFLEHFPHRYIPHVVWIDVENRKVMGSTLAKELNEQNIASFLSTKFLSLPIKQDDFQFDVSKTLLVDGNAGASNLFVFRSIITNEINGINMTTGWRPMEGNRNRIFALNQTVYSLMKRGWLSLNKVEYNRTYINDTPLMDIDLLEAKRFCYELIIPKSGKEEINQFIREDLIKYLNVQVEERERSLPFISISKQGDRSSPDSLTGESQVQLNRRGLPNVLQHVKLSEAVRLLNIYSSIPLVFSKENSEYDPFVSIDLPDDLSDAKRVSVALNSAGIDTQEKMGNLKVVHLIIPSLYL